MLAHLFDVSPEVFQKIALFAVLSTPRGPPRDIYNLSLVCRASHRILSVSSAQLYTDTFSHNFDIQAPECRLGKAALQENAKMELQRRFTALKSFRRGDLDDPQLTEAFWIAYLMLEDSDPGLKNVQQLIGAGLGAFLDNFLRRRLYEGSAENSGWPLPNERNSLALALFWLSSSQCQRFYSILTCCFHSSCSICEHRVSGIAGRDDAPPRTIRICSIPRASPPHQSVYDPF
jgi:hypothetical protein